MKKVVIIFSSVILILLFLCSITSFVFSNTDTEKSKACIDESTKETNSFGLLVKSDKTIDKIDVCEFGYKNTMALNSCLADARKEDKLHSLSIKILGSFKPEFRNDYYTNTHNNICAQYGLDIK